MVDHAADVQLPVTLQRGKSSAVTAARQLFDMPKEPMPRDMDAFIPIYTSDSSEAAPKLSTIIGTLLEHPSSGWLLKDIRDTMNDGVPPKSVGTVGAILCNVLFFKDPSGSMKNRPSIGRPAFLVLQVKC